MDQQFWLDRWQASQIGFHQSETEALLQRHWSELGLTSGTSVFVPLCGKSLDMVWLAAQGHSVIGNELSSLAVTEFFNDLGIAPTTRTEADFSISSAIDYELWCGDFFALPQSATKDLAAIYDRAALIALPAEMRRRYADKITEIAAGKASMLLIALEYDQSILSGPPHSVGADEVKELFADQWQVRELSRQQTRTLSPKFKANGLDSVGEVAYLLSPRKVNR